MIIVSQDKDNIVNFENITSIWIDDNVLDKTNTDFEICADGESLGYYKTEERAKEVLQEIITRHANWGNMKVGQPSGVCLPVYYMPEE